MLHAMGWMGWPPCCMPWGGRSGSCVMMAWTQVSIVLCDPRCHCTVPGVIVVCSQVGVKTAMETVDHTILPFEDPALALALALALLLALAPS